MKTHHASMEPERLELALEAAQMGTWDWNIETGEISWDEQMHRIFGIKADSFPGQCDDFLQLIHPEDRDRVDVELTKAVANGEEWDSEFRTAPGKSSKARVIRMRSRMPRSKEIQHVLGVAWDVTERRHTEIELNRERALLSALMENLPDHIYFKDVYSRFLAVNRAMAEWAGFAEPKELMGKTDADLFTAEHAKRALKDEQEIMRTGVPIINNEEKETWADREDTWVSTTKLPLKDRHGEIIGTFGLSRDITDRKRADERLARMTEELKQRNAALQEDLEMARELQNALLPQRYPSFPHGSEEKDSAVRFYHFFQPSATVSGDFFDVLDISNNAAGLLICDVMGHGVRAALVAATVRAHVSELRALWPEPGKFLSKLNRALQETYRNSETTLFASAFYVVADLSKHELRYANAGHPYPLRVAHHQHDGTTKSMPLNGEKPGPALGLIREAEYQTHRSALSPRELLLLFTDGLFEVEGAGGSMYDYHKLAQAVGTRSGLPANELCRSLITDVRQFSANKQFSDDVCLVAMDIRKPDHR